ncbi:MAG: DUF429 domain-containing protein [Euryarchaeota archaeon]|nr:DUF429 domain-containing protein [Euryarchaeota archaeon]
MTLCAGADARAGGWVLVLLKGGHLHAMERHRTFPDLLSRAQDAEVVTVDVPLGHDDPDGVKNKGRRACDISARRFVGPVADRIDLAPPPVLFTYPDRSQAVREATAKGWPTPSERLWSLRERMEEAQAAAQVDDRIVEVHPELSFHALLREETDRDHLVRPQATWDGLVERLGLLHKVGLRPARSFGGLGLVTPQDVLSATVTAWSALRVAERRALSFPETGEIRLWC